MSRRWLIGLAISVAVAAIIGVAALMVFLLRDSSGPAITPPQVTPAASATPTVSSVPSPSIPSQFQPRESLVVNIHYTRSDTFTLSIDEVRRTYEVPTAARLAPQEGAPYSLLQLIGPRGTTISEHRFTMTTTVTGEAFSATGEISAETIELPENDLTIVVPVPASGSVARLRLVTPDGRLLDDQPINYEQLPYDTPPPSPLSRLWHWLTRDVLAQEDDGKFTIIITNDHTIPNAQLLASWKTIAENVRDQFDPWTTYKDDIEVKIVVNSNDDLECSNDFTVIFCDLDEVARFVNNRAPEWDAVVVVTPFTSGRATAGRGDGIVAIATVPGYDPTHVLAHELGHATGILEDEYLNEPYANEIVPHRNCFIDFNFDPSAAIDACEQAIDPYRGQIGVACVPGCTASSFYRPFQNGLMLNSSNTEYGPVQECLLGKEIANKIGKTHDCQGPESPNASPSPGQPTPPGPEGPRYWGGGR